ncbi:MAG TPA: ArsA-related P-loop ATPase [Actinomycetota bacterium]
MGTTLTGARVVVVSGKGGVGKTTVAAALAIAAAHADKRVLLVELEDREAFAPLFGLRRISYEPQHLAPNVTGLTVEADEALFEYLKVSYKIPSISRSLIRSRAVEFATQTAPGLKDILLIGKTITAAGETRDGKPVYDLVVVDAPPTGRLPRFLGAPQAVADLVRAGPIRRQAIGVHAAVVDPRRLQVVLVTLPEEMPVRETLEAAEHLAKMNVALGPFVVNAVLPPPPEHRDDARRDLAAAGATERQADAVMDVAERHARRAANQAAAIAGLRAEADTPIVELPYLFTEPLAYRDVETLAALMIEQEVV